MDFEVENTEYFTSAAHKQKRHCDTCYYRVHGVSLASILRELWELLPPEDQRDNLELRLITMGVL